MTPLEKDNYLQAGFTWDQIQEIEEGRKLGLRTAVYENKEFLSLQMRQIKIGLMERLPVEIYAHPQYDWFQMEELRKGLKAKVDIKVYATPDMPYEKMREIRKGLENGINLMTFLKMPAGVIREIRKAKVAGVNTLKYINEGYDAEQLAEIRCALEKGVDIDPYLCKEYRAASIVQIRKGLERGVDVSLYADVHYSWRQMREIRKGLENRVEVEKYLSKLYSWEQMREIRLGLEQGFDVDGYRLLRYTADEMCKKRLTMLEKYIIEQEAIRANQIQSEDFMFEFTANDMEVYATLLVQGKEITKPNLLKLLEENDIRKGIQEDAIERIVEGRCGTTAFLLAKGEQPQQGEDGWYEFFFRTDIDTKPKEQEDGTVDFQNIDWFEMVQTGQKLAYYHEAKEGIDGYSVKGEVIKGRKGSEQRILTGKGFQLEQDKKTYTAITDGMISLNGNDMQITNHMEVEEVNMATGNLNFNGSIHIRGDVCNGTSVKATGDVVVDGNVEAVTIESGGSVVLKKGMNAAGDGEIIAGKDVVSRFFEATKVTAQGNIDVDKCLNSELYAGGVITSTKVIAGGVAQAEKGFRLRNVGNQAGRPTALVLKVNDTAWEENRKVKSAIRDVEKELQMLANMYKEFKEKFPAEARSKMPTFIKVEKALFVKKKQFEQLTQVNEELEASVKKVGEAKVIITGQAYEGTSVDINGSKWFAKDQYNITIKKQEGQVEVYNN